MPLENPYRHGAYHFTVETLMKMGVNKAHKFSAFAGRFEKVWSNADAEGWKAFKTREARNKETSKDVAGRIFQNCRVLQRTKDYGKPLLRAGAVIDLTRNDRGEMMIALNTKSRRPQKPGRAPKAVKPEAKPAKRKAKSTRKPTVGKKKVGNASGEAREPNQTATEASESAESAIGDQRKSE